MMQPKIMIYWLAASVVVAATARAQMFATEKTVESRLAGQSMPGDVKSPAIVGANNAETTAETLDNKSIDENNNQESRTKSALTDKVKAEEEEDIFIPEGELYRLNTPTADGSVRGGQAFVEVDEQGRMKKVDNIFLFYDQFQISGYTAETVSCNVRFNVLSNLDRSINQLDVKLVWPDITTTLSFADVAPNTQTYYNYALLGKGCYSMDKAPNIIVNRCRVKGMTAAECANKIIWLSK